VCGREEKKTVIIKFRQRMGTVIMEVPGDNGGRWFSIEWTRSVHTHKRARPTAAAGGRSSRFFRRIFLWNRFVRRRRRRYSTNARIGRVKIIIMDGPRLRVHGIYIYI